MSRFFAHVPLSMVEPFWFFYYLLSESGCVLFFQNWLHCLKRRHLRVNRVWKKVLPHKNFYKLENALSHLAYLWPLLRMNIRPPWSRNFSLKVKAKHMFLKLIFIIMKSYRITCANILKATKCKGFIWKAAVKFYQVWLDLFKYCF